MDTSDPKISFDDRGICEYCNNFIYNIKPSWDKQRSEQSLLRLSSEIKKRAGNAEYDCIIGLSGGLDSSYATHVAVNKMGLKPLLVHVDAGWNTNQAVGNIERLVEGLQLDLFTDVVEWDQVKEMQLAFLRSGIPDQDLVQDAAFFTGLYKFARKYSIRSVITGSNFSTECCREPEEWGGYLGIDKTLFKDIYRRYGAGKKSKFPLIDIIKYKFVYQRLMGMKMYHPLNFVEFNKQAAEIELNSLYGWKPFKHKHHESRFTVFYEDFWLPKRFGFEKRRAHFSSLILTGQLGRTEALDRLSKPELTQIAMDKEIKFVADKLEIKRSDLDLLMQLPKKTYADYKNKRWLIMLGAYLFRLLGLEKRYFRK
jgi:N-acetyl sugar amidotransferase